MSNGPMSNPPSARRRMLAFAAGASALVGVGARAQAQAQVFAWKPVQLVVPSPAGSPPDLRARELGELLAPLVGQAVVVINKPGAGGAIGMQAVAASAPDGHTIVVCNNAPLTINRSLYERLPYDPVKDFAPVMIASRVTVVLVVRRSLHAGSLTELVRLARRQPGKLFFGSAGNGTPPHVLAELFRHTAGLDVVHVPYKGGPAAITGLIAGDVSFVVDAASQVLPHIASGQLEALAVSGDERLASLPDVPTFAECGIADMDGAWTGILVPARTPRETVQRLNREFTRALETPALRALYRTIGISVVASSPEALARRIDEETPRWREIVKRAGITPG
jgi:tripartite-type tricarboxylate transporter receptor subunit TctC